MHRHRIRTQSPIRYRRFPANQKRQRAANRYTFRSMTSSSDPGSSNTFLQNVVLPPGALLFKAQAVARAVGRQGGRAFLVGGYVRDALLGLSPKDADIEVYGLEAAALRRVLEGLGHVNCVGESFRVYKLVWHERVQNTPRNDGSRNDASSDHNNRTQQNAKSNAAAPSAAALTSAAALSTNAPVNRERHELDVSLPRRDRKTGEGHRGFEVEGDPNASFEDACRRRDFTINALLCDPLDGALIDPFNGALDLKNRLLRAVDPLHFAEDSLRVLRAVQFAARFQMQVEPQTIALCRSIDLGDLPRERIWGECEKWLLKAARPSLGLEAARELDVLQKLFPALRACMSTHARDLCAALDRGARERDAMDEEEGQARDDAQSAAGAQSAASISRLASRPARQAALMLATIGAWLESETEFLDSLGIKTIAGYDVRAQVLALRDLARFPGQWYAQSQRGDAVFDGDLRRVALRCEPRLLMHLARALGDEDAASWFIERMRALGVEHGAPAPLLLGRRLLEMGLKTGPRIGQITRAIYQMQLDGTVSTHAQALEAARAMIEE